MASGDTDSDVAVAGDQVNGAEKGRRFRGKEGGGREGGKCPARRALPSQSIPQGTLYAVLYQVPTRVRSEISIATVGIITKVDPK